MLEPRPSNCTGSEIYYSYAAVQKRTVMLIVAGNAPGFFTESGSLIPFSVDLSDCCRIFTVKNNTTIKIYIGHDVLIMNEVHNVIEENRFLEILTTV